MCHRVSSRSSGKENGVSPLKFETGMPLEHFEKLMRFVNDQMHPVSLEEVVNFVTGKKGIPDRAVAVTFDDGYMDNYINAFPILKRYQIPATIFLTTGFIGTELIFWWDRIGEILKRTRIRELEMNGVRDFLSINKEWIPDLIHLNTQGERNGAWDLLTKALRQCSPDRVEKTIEFMEDRLEVRTEAYRHLHLMLTWEQIQEMSEAGIDFGAHTVSHPYLSESTADDFEKEVLGSKKVIEDRIRKPVTSFAYPFGDFASLPSAFKKRLREYGFQCAFLAEEGYVSSESDPYEMKRLGVEDASVGIVVRELTTLFRQNTY